ncbi:MAG TPA: TetR/AcrR family transcriptional regulator [Actinomycetes bacterium]|nr:TetR/AcrR family transcriptional regulator [Actinomycetes bacterium]
MAERLAPRARQIVQAARELLEQEGAEALTMRRLAERLGIRAPSLYKHLPDKAAVEAAVIATGLVDVAAALEAALAAARSAGTEPLAALAAAYRAFALAHPHLYRLMTGQPLPRDRLPAGVEARAAAPLLQAAGNQDLARAAWAFAHGMVQLELARRFPPGADLHAAWQEGITALQGRVPARDAAMGGAGPADASRRRPSGPARRA